MEFTVVIEKDEDGIFVAEVPYLKGCYTQGKTVEEAVKNIREVIGMCIREQKPDLSKTEFVGVQLVEVSQ